jgi:hypothetical protein
MPTTSGDERISDRTSAAVPAGSASHKSKVRRRITREGKTLINTDICRRTEKASGTKRNPPGSRRRTAEDHVRKTGHTESHRGAPRRSLPKTVCQQRSRTRYPRDKGGRS